MLPLLAALVIGAACGGDDDDDDGSDPTATTAAESPTEETPAEESPTEAAESPTEAEAGSPTKAETEPAADGVTVTDMLGREVTVPADPQRIVALSPTAVELVYAAGGTVVGRTSTATHPPEAEAAEDIGSAYAPNPEVILALEPDLIVADAIIHAVPGLREIVEGLGVPVVFAGANSYQEVTFALLLMGEALGNEEAANASLGQMEEDLAAAQDMVSDLGLSAIILIGGRDASDRNVYGAKTTSYAGDLLGKLGVENPAADLPDSGPFPGFATVPPEQLASSNPDFIFALSPAPEPAPRLSDVLPLLPGVSDLDAVTNGRLIELDVDLFLQSPGPRAGEAALELAQIISENAPAQ